MKPPVDPETTFNFPYFPVPQPGETVYSVVSRYVARSTFPVNGLVSKLTGQRWRKPLLSPLPGYISNIANRMPPGHPWQDPNSIVNLHTILPYLIYFDSLADRSDWQQRLHSAQSSQQLCLSLGLLQFRMGSPTFHFCPSCIKEDQKNLGFAIFRLEHQLPYVSVCFRHGVPLAKGCTHCGPYPLKGKRWVFTMAGKCCCDEISPLASHTDLPRESDLLMWIARESAYILNSSCLNLINIRSTIRKLVLEHGFRRRSKLDCIQLGHAIEQRFGKEMIDWLNVTIKAEGRTGWIGNVLSEKKGSQTRCSNIYFLLIIGTLFKSMAEFEKAAEAYLQPESVNSAEIQLTSHVPSWSEDLFRLIQCKNRTIHDISNELGISIWQAAREALQRKWRIPLSQQTRYPLCERKVEAIRSDLIAGVDKNTICKKHKCHDWTITRVLLDNPYLEIKSKSAAANKRLENNKQRICEFLNLHPLASRCDLIQALPGPYDFLMKWDRQWLNEKIPKKGNVRRTHSPRINWAILDDKKAQEAEQVFKKILSSDLKPIRASATAVLTHIRLLHKFHENRDKFPLTAIIIGKYSETRQNFVKRRINFGIKEMAVGGHSISVNKLRHFAGLSSRVLHENKDFIIEACRNLDAKICNKSFFA